MERPPRSKPLQATDKPCDPGQDAEDQGLARVPPALASSLHADISVLDQGGAVVCRADAQDCNAASVDQRQNSKPISSPSSRHITKLMASAPGCLARANRSGTLSTVMTRCAPHDCALDAELANRAATPYCHNVDWLDVAVGGSHPTGRKNVAKKQCLLVMHSVGNDNRGHVCIGNAYKLSLATRICARQTGIAE
jgi:hypothetical protein